MHPMSRALRDAGAIIIGKTNVPEFGLGSNTYNPVFGPTANAYSPTIPQVAPAAARRLALATRLLPVADGSDFGGVRYAIPAPSTTSMACGPVSGAFPPIPRMSSCPA